MGLSLWALRVKGYWVSGSQWIDHLSEFIPYSTTRTPASKVPAHVVRPAAKGAIVCFRSSSTLRDEKRLSLWKSTSSEMPFRRCSR